MVIQYPIPKAEFACEKDWCQEGTFLCPRHEIAEGHIEFTQSTCVFVFLIVHLYFTELFLAP